MPAVSTSQAPEELSAIYRRRFAETAKYRNEVWKVLSAEFFSRWVRDSDAVLDLGCGYGEFINNIGARQKFAMDLNPDARAHLNTEVQLLEQDCSDEWQLADSSLDVVFTSNFFEHLRSKDALRQTIAQAYRCLRPGGRIIAMGPNIKFLPGAYWDFFDHHVALTEKALAEGFETGGLQAEWVVARFLPYTLVDAPQYPLVLLRLYLRLQFLWWLKGRQFLVIARKAAN